MFHTLRYRVLPEQLAVCKLAANAGLPAWVLAAKTFCAVRTADELSVVCAEDRVPADAPFVEKGWIALKLEGPFPLAATGVLLSFLQPLAQAKIPIFAISTYDTDYVLIKQGDAEQARKALTAAGHGEQGGLQIED